MKNLPQQLKGIAVTTVFFVGLLYVQAWVGPTQTAPNGNVEAPVNVSTFGQVKSGPLGVMGIITAYSNLSVNGLLTAAGTFRMPNGSGAGKVLTSDATGNASWGTETDPTVLTSVKDGVSWAEVTGKPTVISSITGGACAVGSVIQSISSTGVATCVADSTGSGGISSITGGACSAGQVVKSISSTGVATCGSEIDPTVATTVKDGVDWTEVTNKPTGITSGNSCPALSFTVFMTITPCPAAPHAKVCVANVQCGQEMYQCWNGTWVLLGSAAVCAG